MRDACSRHTVTRAYFEDGLAGIVEIHLVVSVEMRREVGLAQSQRARFAILSSRVRVSSDRPFFWQSQRVYNRFVAGSSLVVVCFFFAKLGDFRFATLVLSIEHT